MNALSDKTAPRAAPGLKIETRSIDYVPRNERHGKVWHQGPFWFTGNFVLTTMVTGFTGAALGLSLVYAVLAIVIGVCLGTFAMAFHANQGPRMGLPQMIQSRAQFGLRGAIVPFIAVIFVYIGFNVFNVILATDAINTVLPGSRAPWYALMIILAVVIAVIGHDLLHTVQRWLTYVMISVFAVLTVAALMSLSADAAVADAHFSWSAFLIQLSAAAGYQISYAVYVSDYSRYLPADVPVAATFWTTYLGSALGSSLAFIFGAVAVLATPVGMDTMDAVKLATGAIGPLMLVLFLLSVISHNALNLYGAVLSIITLVQTFAYSWIPTAKSRAVISIIVLAACSIAAVFASQDFIGHFVDMVLVLLVVLVPWTAINLIDFYAIHKGKYDIASIFRVDGGIYGKYNPQALLAYAVGIAVQIPFMNTPLYVGPISQHINGADLSWVVGLAVTSPLYFWLASRDSAYKRRMDSGKLVGGV